MVSPWHDVHLDCKFNTSVIIRFWRTLDPPQVSPSSPWSLLLHKSPGGREHSRGTTTQRPRPPTRHPPCAQGTLEKITSPGASWSCLYRDHGQQSRSQPWRVLHHRELCTAESFARWKILHQRALRDGKLCTTESFKPWRALRYGELCTTDCVAPWRALHHRECCRTPSCRPPLRRHTQPQLTRGPASTQGSPNPAQAPRFPHLGLARLLAAPLRGEEGSVMAGIFQRTVNLPASHASQLQPGSDLYASEVHQREKYFPGAVYPPSLLSSSPVRAARIQSPVKKPRPHPSPSCVTPCPRHPAQALPLSPASASKRKLPLASSPP